MTPGMLLDLLPNLVADFAMGIVVAAVPFVLGAMLFVRGRTSSDGEVYMSLARTCVILGMSTCLMAMYGTGHYQGLKGKLHFVVAIGLLGEAWFAYMQFIWVRFTPLKPQVQNLPLYRLGWWSMVSLAVAIPALASFVFIAVLALLLGLGLLVAKRLIYGVQKSARGSVYLRNGWIVTGIALVGLLTNQANGGPETVNLLFGSLFFYSPVLSAALALTVLDARREESLLEEIEALRSSLRHRESEAGLSAGAPPTESEHIVSKGVETVPRVGAQVTGAADEPMVVRAPRSPEPATEAARPAGDPVLEPLASGEKAQDQSSDGGESAELEEEPVPRRLQTFRSRRRPFSRRDR